MKYFLLLSFFINYSIASNTQTDYYSVLTKSLKDSPDKDMKQLESIISQVLKLKKLSKNNKIILGNLKKIITLNLKKNPIAQKIIPTKKVHHTKKKNCIVVKENKKNDEYQCIKKEYDSLYRSLEKYLKKLDDKNNNFCKTYEYCKKYNRKITQIIISKNIKYKTNETKKLKNTILNGYYKLLLKNIKIKYISLPKQCDDHFTQYLSEKTRAKVSSNLKIARLQYDECINIYTK